jgi:hypothetical protein
VELKSLILRVDILNIWIFAISEGPSREPDAVRRARISAIRFRRVELGLCVSISKVPSPSILCILTAAGASILTNFPLNISSYEDDSDEKEKSRLCRGFSQSYIRRSIPPLLKPIPATNTLGHWHPSHLHPRRNNRPPTLRRELPLLALISPFNVHVSCRTRQPRGAAAKPIYCIDIGWWS